MAKRLVLKGPRRRESARVKSRSASTISTRTTTTSAEDTVVVARQQEPGAEVFDGGATQSPRDSYSTGSEEPELPQLFQKKELPLQNERPQETQYSQQAQHVQQTVQSQISDENMADELDEDPVSEYDFSREEQFSDDDTEYRGIFKDTAEDVITISSDDEGAETENFKVDARPWLSMTLEQRREWERMCCNVQPDPLDGDWEKTEFYQKQNDIQTLQYLEDFPLLQWALPYREAVDGYNRLMNRIQWRHFNVAIYGYTYNPMAREYQRLDPVPVPPPQSQVHRHHHREDMYAQSHLRGLPIQHSAHHQNHLTHETIQGLHPHMPMPPQYHPAYNRVLQEVGRGPQGQPLYEEVRAPVFPPSSQYPGFVRTPVPPTMPPLPLRTDKPDKGKRKRQSPGNALTAPIRATANIIPPYPARDKPSSEIRKAAKSGIVIRRRTTAQIEFPWNRGIDFAAAVPAASWNNDIYDPVTLDQMEAVRILNAKYVQKVDIDDIEKMRTKRLNKMQAAEDASESEKPRRQKKVSKAEEQGIQDSSEGSGAVTVTSGSFCFATHEDSLAAASFGGSLPEDIMEAVDDGKIELDACGGIKICWNAAKKGLTQDLKQVEFSVSDSMRTRAQLANTPVLTGQAALSIIDFCPDLLWREILLRITSETELRNMHVRDRMCKNGNYIDKATITKRIGAALGQKPAYAPGEKEFHHLNVDDYANYQAYFGKGPIMRKKGLVQPEKSKLGASSGGEGRESSALESDGNGVTATGSVMKSSASKQLTAQRILERMGKEDVDDAEKQNAIESAEVSDNDLEAVSIQSDGELDKMADD